MSLGCVSLPFYIFPLSSTVGYQAPPTQYLAQVPQPEAQPLLIQTQSPHQVPNSGQVLQPIAGQIQVQSMQAQVQPPEAQVQPPQAQVQPPQAQIQPPQAQVQPPQAQVQPPAAQV